MWQDRYLGDHSIELEEQLAKLEKRYRWVHPYTLLRFEVSVVEHCNLKCRNCSHYSPLAQEEYLDVDEYARDCARLSELFDSEVKYIRLLGGEPLLHPRLPEIMGITREAFRVGKIRLVTNGVLLPSMGSDFWNACRDYQITLSPTEYPISFDYNTWEKNAKARGVLYEAIRIKNVDEGAADKLMRRDLIDTSGRNIVEQNYYHCTWANNCLQLRHGHLYTCHKVAYAYHLNRHFDLELHLSERNGVDIYEVKDAYELMTKVNRPIPFCQYCNLRSNNYEEDWAPSRKDRYEWLDFEWNREDIRYLKEAPCVYVYGAGKMGEKAVARLKKNGVAVSAVLAGEGDEYPGSVQDVPVIKAGDMELKEGVCLLAVDDSEKTQAGRTARRCGIRQIIPLYVC